MAQDIALRSPGSGFDIALSAGGTSVNADATGAATAGQAGTVTVVGHANASATGAAIAGQADTVTATGTPTAQRKLGPWGLVALYPLPVISPDATANPTGAAIAGQAGTVTVTAVANVSTTLTGAAIAGAAGTATSTATSNVSTTLTGASSAAAAGTVTSTATTNVSFSITGAASLAEAGTATSTATSSVSASITGAAIAAAAGAVSVTAGGSIDVNATGAQIAAQAQVTTQTGHANTNTTGAAIAAQAGTATGEGSVAAAPSQRQIGPWGLAALYPLSVRSPDVEITGASARANSGNITVTLGRTRRSISPLVLATPAREFSKLAPQQDVFVNISGAKIELQFNYPDSASVAIYPDSAEVDAQGGGLNDAVLVGAAAAAAAGTVVVDVSTSNPITGAKITAGAGQSAAGPGLLVNADSAQIAAQAGTVTVEHGVAVSISGARINAQASEGGLDTETVVSVTIEGIAILAEASAPALAGPHVSVNIDGAQINGEAGLQEQQPSRGGRYRRHRGKRYVVEVDNQLFDVRSPEHAQELLAQVRDLAEDAAERDVQSDRPHVPKVRIRTAAGNESKSNAIQLARLEAQKAINAAYAKQVERRKIDREIAELMLALMQREAIEQDEEDAIIALLLF